MGQVDPNYTSDARASKILQERTYHDGCRYQVGMLWADDESLPNNHSPGPDQWKECRIERTPDLKTTYAQPIKNNFDKGYIVQVDKSSCFLFDNPRT